MFATAMREVKSSLSYASNTNNLCLGGVEVEDAVLLPIWRLVLMQLPVHFGYYFVDSVGELFYLYFVFYYYGLDVAVSIALLKSAQLFIIESIPRAIHFSAAGIFAHFIAGGETNAASAIYTYGVVCGLFFALLCLICFLAITNVFTEALCPPSAVNYAEEYCYSVVVICSIVHTFSTHLQPYFLVESREITIFTSTTVEQVVKLTLFLMLELFITSKGLPDRWIIFTSEIAGAICAMFVPLILDLIPVLRSTRMRYTARFSFKFMSPLKPKLLREVMRGAWSRLLYNERHEFLVFMCYIIEVATHGFSIYSKNSLLQIAYYGRFRALASSFLAASTPVVQSIGFFNLLLKRTERVHLLMRQSLFLFIGISSCYAFLLGVCEPRLRRWINAPNSIRHAVLDGMLCVPIEVAYNASLIHADHWRLFALAIMHYVVGVALLTTQAFRGNIGESGEVTLYLATVATAVYEIPTLAGFFRPPKVCLPPERPQKLLQREDSLSLSTRRESRENENLSDIEPVALEDGPATPEIKETFDVAALDFTLEDNYHSQNPE